MIWSVAAAVVVAGLAAVLLQAPLPGRQVAERQGFARPVASAAAPVTAGGETPASVAPTARSVTTSAGPPAKPVAKPPAKPVAAPLAGRIRPNVTYRGKATFYEAGDGSGACGFGPAGDMMIGAMNQTDYESAKACGAYVLVRAANGASVRVRITNLCPLPCAPGQIDLSPQAFDKLGKRSLGEIPITWQLVSPDLPTKISVRYKTGSSKWWCAPQVINHRNPVARLEIRVGNGWRQLPRAGYNYFISAHGDGCGAAIRVTDIYGQKLTLTGIAIKPDVVQPTKAQFARH
jgi:expansin